MGTHLLDSTQLIMHFSECLRHPKYTYRTSRRYLLTLQNCTCIHMNVCKAFLDKEKKTSPKENCFFYSCYSLCKSVCFPWSHPSQLSLGPSYKVLLAQASSKFWTVVLLLMLPFLWDSFFHFCSILPIILSVWSRDHAVSSFGLPKARRDAFQSSATLWFLL